TGYARLPAHLHRPFAVVVGHGARDVAFGGWEERVVGRLQFGFAFDAGNFWQRDRINRVGATQDDAAATRDPSRCAAAIGDAVERHARRARNLAPSCAAVFGLQHAPLIADD